MSVICRATFKECREVEEVGDANEKIWLPSLMVRIPFPISHGHCVGFVELILDDFSHQPSAEANARPR
jgi:hypothetical protein